MVGIDCFCKDPAGLYQDTPQKFREELELDLLIFTHEHEDHFCGEYVKEAWKKNPNLQIYAGEMVIRILDNEKIPSNNLHQVGEGHMLKIDNVEIVFAESVHEGAQYAHIQNLTLLINKGDKKLVVTGDAMPCKELFERIKKWSPYVDWMFAPFPYVGIRSTRKLMEEHLEIRNIFVLHQPRPKADCQNWVANTRRVCAMAKDSLPHPVFPEQLGERHCF